MVLGSVLSPGTAEVGEGVKLLLLKVDSDAWGSLKQPLLTQTQIPSTDLFSWWGGEWRRNFFIKYSSQIGNSFH